MNKLAYGFSIALVMTFILQILGILIPGKVYSQNLDWTVFTSMSYVTCVADDEESIWVGSKGGLTKIDKLTGEKVTFHKANSNLPDNYVQSLAIDNAGNIWIGMQNKFGSPGGLVKFDGQYWTIYNIDNSQLPSNNVVSLAIDSSEAVWIATKPHNIWGESHYEPIGFANGGVAKFDGENWTVYDTTSSDLPDNYIQILSIDKLGNVWIGAGERDKSCLVRFDGVSWNIFYSNDPEIFLSCIKGIAFDDSMNVWLGTKKTCTGPSGIGGLVKFDGENWTIFKTNNSNIPDNDIYGLDIDWQGNIWIGTTTNIFRSIYGFRSGNLIKYDGENWTIYSPDDSGLPDGGILCLSIDRQGNVLIGTRYRGLTKFDGQTWIHYESDLPSSMVNTIAFDSKGNKWIGTQNGGLTKFDGNQWETYDPMNSDFPDTYVKKIAIDSSDNKWIATNDLVKFDDEDWTVFTEDDFQILKSTIYDLVIEADSILWIACREGGIMKFDGNIWSTYDRTDTGIILDKINSITIDFDTCKWIGTTKQGLLKFDGTSWMDYNTNNSDLPNDCITSIAIDLDGTKWIGTYSGLTKFDDTNWTVFTSDNSELPGNRIYVVAIDLKGNKWIACDDIQNRNVHSLTKFDGLNWTFYNMSHFFSQQVRIKMISCDPLGNVWICTDEGLAVYPEGGVILTNVTETKHQDISLKFALSKNYPNPFNPSTKISFSVAKQSPVKIVVYNMLGELIRILTDHEYPVGTYHIQWNGTDMDDNPVASGVYFYRISGRTEAITNKMILLR